jgi:hypothetical protein
MKSVLNATRMFLGVLTVVFFLGAAANTYLVFKPSRYTPAGFDPASVSHWFVFIFNVLFILGFYAILKNVPNTFARIYWFALLALFASGFIEKYFIRFSAAASQLFSALGCTAICLISIMFLYLHRKYRFDLFAGFTLHFKKKLQVKTAKPF